MATTAAAAVRTTTTRTVDQFGTVGYTVARDGQEIGTLRKAGRGSWDAFLPSGSYIPRVSSITKAVALIERCAAR